MTDDAYVEDSEQYRGWIVARRQYKNLEERIEQLEKDKITLELNLSYLQWQIDNLKTGKTND